MIRALLITEDLGLQAAFEVMAADSGGLRVQAADAEDALALARAEPCDVILVDGDSIGDAAGLAAALTLVQTAPVAVLTGPELTAPRRDELLQAGADAVRAKPAGTSAPTLAGRDGPAFAAWVASLAEAAR